MKDAPPAWGKEWEFRLLGPVAIADEHRSISPGGRRQQAVVAALLTHRNTCVPVSRLIDYVWGDAAPPSAVNSLQSYVSRFRKLLEPVPSGGSARLVRSLPGGYSLHAPDDQVDGVRFARLVADGRSLLEAGRATEAHGRLTRALRLWRGPAMAGLTDHKPLAAEIARLEESRTSATEYLAAAALALGRNEESVALLEGVIRECPLREGPRAGLMLALYRSGRQAEALALFRTTRKMLIDELGVEPGRDLARLQQSILRQDPALARRP